MSWPRAILTDFGRLPGIQPERCAARVTLPVYCRNLLWSGTSTSTRLLRDKPSSLSDNLSPLPRLPLVVSAE